MIDAAYILQFEDGILEGILIIEIRSFDCRVPVYI